MQLAPTRSFSKPTFGNQGYASYGSTGYGSFGYSNLGYGSYGYGSPGYGNQIYGSLGYGNQGYGNLGYGNLGYGNLGYTNPCSNSPFKSNCNQVRYICPPGCISVPTRNFNIPKYDCGNTAPTWGLNVNDFSGPVIRTSFDNQDIFKSNGESASPGFPLAPETPVENRLNEQNVETSTVLNVEPVSTSEIITARMGETPSEVVPTEQPLEIEGRISNEDFFNTPKIELMPTEEASKLPEVTIEDTTKFSTSPIEPRLLEVTTIPPSTEVPQIISFSIEPRTLEDAQQVKDLTDPTNPLSFSTMPDSTSNVETRDLNQMTGPPTEFKEVVDRALDAMADDILKKDSSTETLETISSENSMKPKKKCKNKEKLKKDVEDWFFKNYQSLVEQAQTMKDDAEIKHLLKDGEEIKDRNKRFIEKSDIEPENDDKSSLDLRLSMNRQPLINAK